MNLALAHPLYLALKSSLAALLALALVQLFQVNDRLSATFVSVACLTPTVYSGLRRGLDQLGASAIGGALTWALGLFLPRAPTLALALFASVWISFRVGLGRGFLVASFTVLYVLLIPGASPGVALASRLSSVAIGAVSAIVVNLSVSMLTYHSLFSRRLKIARSCLATEYRRLADALAGSTFPADLFEASFPLLRTLHEELSDAVQESRLRGARHRERLSSALEAAHHLLAVAHYGKDLALTQAERPGLGSTQQAAARRLADALGEAAAVPPEPGADPRLASAARAWERARTAEGAFQW